MVTNYETIYGDPIDLDEEQNVISSGYRDSLGNIKSVVTSSGEHTLGVSLTKDENTYLEKFEGLIDKNIPIAKSTGLGRITFFFDSSP